MNQTIALSRLEQGHSAYVTQVGLMSGLYRRLMELGVIRGTRITCLYRSPFGDPTAYLIRGAVIALREKDAQQVLVEREMQPRSRNCPATTE